MKRWVGQIPRMCQEHGIRRIATENGKYPAVRPARAARAGQWEEIGRSVVFEPPIASLSSSDELRLEGERYLDNRLELPAVVRLEDRALIDVFA